MQFDARAAKLLQPGAHIIVADCPGLRLEASVSRKAWIYRFKSPVDGRMRQIKLGDWPALSPVSAAAEWERLRGIRDSGVDPAQEKRAAKAQERETVRKEADSGIYTVRKVCDDYLAGHISQRRNAKGQKEVARLFDDMLGDVGGIPAEKVTRRIAFELLEANAHKPVVAGQLRAELGAAWDYALDAGRLSEETPNWWRMVHRGRLKSKGKKIAGEHIGTTKRALNDQEVGVLINWLPNFSRLVDDLLTMYLWTGTRGAEIVAIEKSEVTEEDDGLWWTCPKRKTKNARHENATDLRVPLVGRAAAVVRRRMAQADRYLFPMRGGAGHVQQKVAQTTVFYHQPYSETRPDDIRPRLPVTHWSPHDLRRTVRTMLAGMGCPDEIAEAVLGHMPPGIKGVYNLHRYDAERRLWLTRLNERLEALAAKHRA